MKQVYSRACTLFSIIVLVFSVKMHAQISVSVTSQVNILCNGGNNGSAIAALSGGIGPFSYLWMPGNISNDTATGLVAGNYTVTVTDSSNMSTATASCTITQPLPLTISVNAYGSTCGQANGWAQAIPSGGTGLYSYLWVPSGNNSSTANNLISGSYTVTITDSNGCVATQTVTIVNYPGPVIANMNPVTICPGGTTNITPAASGGQGPYTFQWVGPSYFSPGFTLSVSPSVTSTYTCTITDSNGCSDTSSVTVIVSPNLNLSLQTSPATCSQTNGSAIVTASGGVLPYTYLWSNSSVNDSLLNLPAGVYSVTVTDAQGCYNNASVAVNNAGGPALTMSNVNDPTCYGVHNGTATVNVSGNAPPYQYSWNSSPVQTTATATGLSSGIFYCTVTDTNNCISSESVTLTQPPQFFLGAQTVSPSNCTTGGSAHAWASGGNAPYTFAWSNSMSGDTVSGLPSGIYTVTATDNIGCTSTGTISVPAINATLVSGRIYLDANSNCSYDIGDIPVGHQYVSFFPEGTWTTSDSNGYYHAWIYNTGTQTVYSSFNWSSPYVTGFCPANSTVAVTINNMCDTIPNIDFSETIIPGIQDLRVSVSVWPNPRAGFADNIDVSYWNVGSVTVNNTTVSLILDSILTFVSSSIGPTINNPGYLEWNTGTLNPGDHGVIHTVVQVPTIQNGGWIGRPLFYAAAINPNANDQTPVDNGDDEFRHIVSSWDPNEKISFTDGMDSLGNIPPTDSVISYTIFFQNTGNDTAYNIYIIDTLSNYFNPGSIVPLGSSDPFTFEMSGNGIMRFNFNNIMLPDSNHNEPASHGYIKYKATLKSGLPTGTVITNTANIYFDFNPAVVTNTTSNKIWVPTTVSAATTNASAIGAFPNPFDESVHIILPENYNGKICDLVLTDETGRTILIQKNQNANSIIIPRGNLDAGIYFCTVKSNGEMVGTIKLIIN